jgi:hypothetical protein
LEINNYTNPTHYAWQAGIGFFKVSSSIRLAPYQASGGVEI